MNSNRTLMKRLHSITVAVLALLATCASAFGQRGTAFTYQGRLSVSNNPANCYFDL